MPGNEIAEEVHNFFKEDKTLQTHQSEIGNGRRPNFNSNLQVGIQSQSEIPLHVNSKNSTTRSIDSERGNINPSSQPFGLIFTQTNFSPDFGDSQPRNQQLGLKGFMHGSQDTQTRPDQAEFLEDNSFSDRHNSTFRGLATFNPHQGNAPQHSSGLVRNSETPNFAQAPVNFDFRGSQQQLIRSHLLGTLQPHLRQQPGFNNMQLWQQQLMLKQLQQLQRRQQLQQLDQGARQQNPLNQLSSAAKPAAMNQFPALVNEIPINDASNFAWSNNFEGGESKSPGIPQMFVAGNMNWTQPSGSPAMQNLTNGLMFSNDQGQAIQAMGFVPQQLDQSLHGMPVSSSRGSMNQYSQFQGMPSDGMDMMTKTAGNQAEKASMHSGPLRSFQSGQSFAEQAGLQDNISISTQSFQGKSLFGNAMVQSVTSSVASGNLQQANHLQHSFQLQNFQGMQEQADLSGDLHEKPSAQVGPSHDVASLDPTEQKLLFGTDDDDNWGFSFGRSVNSCTGGPLHGNSLDNDYCGAFPSVQSGSWSALMQEAVQASSSDTGHQEEWSGLTFHKTEPSIGNHSAISDDNRKQQATWNDNNLRNAPSLTSRPLPLFNNADASTSLSTSLGFHHSFTSIYEQNDRVPAEASQETFQQSTRETQNKHSPHNQNQKLFLEHGLQSQMHTNDGVGPGQTHGQLEDNSCYATVESKSHNMQGVWTPQQNMPLSNTPSQSSNKPNGWNIKHSLGNDDTKYGQRNNTNRIMNIERSCVGSMWKVGGNQVTLMGGPESVKSDIGSPQMRSDVSCIGNVTSVTDSSTLKVNQEMNQYLFNRHQIDRGKHVALDSSVNSPNDENAVGNQYNRSSGSQAWESTRNGAGKELVENCDSKHEHSKVVSNEDYMSNHPNLGQHSSSGGAARESPLSTKDDPHALGSGSQKSFCQSGQQTLGSHMLQYQPMGSIGMNVRPSVPPLQASYPQGLPRSVIQGSDQEQRYIGHSQFAGTVVSNNVIGMAKGNLANLQRSPKGAEDVQSRGTVSSRDSTGYASFEGSTAQNSQNKGIGQTSPDMLELLHKVDQSRDVKAIATSDITEAAASDISASRSQLVQSSASQGFGLRLGPPSQRQPASNQPSQTSLHDFSSKQFDHESRNKDRTWLGSTFSVQPLPHETSKIENWDTRCSVTGQTCRETSQSYSQVNSSSAAALDLSHTGIQLQQQRQQHHMSRASGNDTMELAAKVSLGSQANLNSSIKNVPLLRQPHEPYDTVLADQPFQTSVPNLVGRTPSFRLASSADTHASPASPFYSAQTNHSQPMDAGFSRAGHSGQQLPVVEPGSGSQPSTSGMPQQVGFSKMLNKVWANISAQRLAGVQPHKLTPAILQSMILSSNNRSAGPWGLQKVDDQKQKGENAPSESGTCSVKSQQAIYGDEHLVMDNSLQQVSSEGVDVAAKTGMASQGQEPMRKHMLEGSPSVSISSLVRLHQQDASKGKHGQDLACNSQIVHVPLTNAASSSGDVGLHWHTSVPSDVKQQNYSLLHQMQAMKGADSDPSKRAGKRLKGADFGSDASQMDWQVCQGLVYGQNTAFRVPADSELGAASHGSFTSDAKMLSFASRDNEVRSASTCSQLPGRETSSQDMRIVGCHDLQTHVHSSSTCSTSGLIGGSKNLQISPQMAPSWFGQYGTYKNGQILAMYDGQRTIKPATQQLHFPKVSGSMDNATIVAQRMDTGHGDDLGRSTLSTTIAANESYPGCLPSDVMDHNIVPRKKRKSATSELLPWHKEVTHGSRRLQTISMAELEWTQASNRLTEKVEDEAEMLEDGLSVSQQRRRLILTTQLMQQLLPAIPAAILKTEATSSYESATYCVSKSALLDACSLIDCSGSDSCMQLDKENTISEKLGTLEKVGGNIYSKVVEDFNGRSKKLESEFLRLDRRTSMLDVRLECQELERFSIVNRLGKFHGRNHTDGVESSSTSENASRKTFLQRYVTALSMHGNLPEGVFCLSL